MIERELDGRRISVWGDENHYTIVVDLRVGVSFDDERVEAIAGSVRTGQDAYPAFSLRDGRLAGYTLDREAYDIFEQHDVVARIALVILAAEAVEAAAR